jgi:DNA-binding MarR family transcriptional regulator
MRVMSAEMRSVEGGVASGHVSMLGILRLSRHTLTDLAALQTVSLPTMSNTVTALEARGWVRRVRSETDRRVVWIEITEEGLAVLARIEEQVAVRIAHYLKELTPEQSQILVDGLTVLRDTFARGLDGDGSSHE